MANLSQLSTICYIDNGSHFLLLHRNKREHDMHRGKYVSVGGKFEPGETPEMCAIREIKEETGLTAHSLKPLGFITFPDFTHNGIDWYSFVYRVTDYSGELIDDCPEGTLEWVAYEDILNKPTWEGDIIFLKWILENKPYFSAQFTYNEAGDLEDHAVSFYEEENDEKTI